MADRYVVVHESKAYERNLPGFEDGEIGTWRSAWALFECDDAGTPIRHVFSDGMEPEDALLVRDLRPLVDELNRLAAAKARGETP